MTAKLRFAVLAVVIFTIACGKSSPFAPTPPVICQDPAANNTGGPVPCTYDTPSPAQSYVILYSTNPASGATLHYKDTVSVIGYYGLSQADQDEAAQTGDTIWAEACFSVDGVTAVGPCSDYQVSGAHGQTNNVLTVVFQSLNPEVSQTGFIIFHLKFRPKDFSKEHPERDIAGTTKAFPAVFYFH